MRDVLATPLNLIYEASIANSDLPQDLKDAYISAILKKGNKRNPNNYRSVSLTCIACKILESIIRDHIIQYMKLFTKSQYGFINGRLTLWGSL